MKLGDSLEGGIIVAREVTRSADGSERVTGYYIEKNGRIILVKLDRGN